MLDREKYVAGTVSSWIDSKAFHGCISNELNSYFAGVLVSPLENIVYVNNILSISREWF